MSAQAFPLYGFRQDHAPHTRSKVHGLIILVLAVALILEGAVWVVALRTFRQSKGELGWVRAVQMSKDPTVFTVLFEDTAAILGLLVAFTGIALSRLLETCRCWMAWPRW